MAASRTLRRLLRVLDLEEEQSKLALESAVSELRRLEQAAVAADGQAYAGRRLIAASAQTGELPDRLAGLEETHAASRRGSAVASRIVAAQLAAENLRQAFLAKRVECRQVETLLREAEKRAATDEGRRSQQCLDSWYLNRLHATSTAPGNRQPLDARHPSSANSHPQEDSSSSREKT
jgi:flagellar biosynthesis chaperone FliJ